MYRVHLEDAARIELKRRTQQHALAPRTRERLEMVRLSDAGWSVPQIASHLQAHPQTVRHWIKAFLAGGFDALWDREHPGQKSAITEAILTAVRERLQQGERTWNAQQVAEWVADKYGIRRWVEQWRRLLRRQRQSYKRTKSHLRPKQDPQEVQQKQVQLAAQQQKGATNCSMSATSTRPASP
jgi:transposase